LDDDLLRQIVPVVTVPAVRIADLVEDFLVLIDHSLEPFLEFWCGHLLPYVASAAVATCTVTLLFAPALKKSQPALHFFPGGAPNDPGASSLPAVRRH
jgi:hypothetical protein